MHSVIAWPLTQKVFFTYRQKSPFMHTCDECKEHLKIKTLCKNRIIVCCLFTLTSGRLLNYTGARIGSHRPNVGFFHIFVIIIKYGIYNEKKNHN